MTRAALADTLIAYRAGLEAELRLLERLRRLSDAQQGVGAEINPAHVTAVMAKRDRLMDGLVAIEDELRPMRQVLSTRRADASALTGFGETVALHRRAERLVAEIVEGDQQTRSALEGAEAARRLAHEMIEKGRSTLSAYRRVIRPTSIAASLVDRRG